MNVILGVGVDHHKSWEVRGGARQYKYLPYQMTSCTVV